MDGIDDPFSLLQWGVLGAVLVAMLTGYLWAKPAVDELRREGQEHKIRGDKMEADVLPEMERVNRDLQRLETALTELAREVHELVRDLAREPH